MRRGFLYLLPVIGAALGVLWSSCHHHDKTTQPEPAGLRIHEWGVLVGCISDTSYFMTSRPEMVAVVREPVIYIHSSDKVPLTVQARFAAGTPTVTIAVLCARKHSGANMYSRRSAYGSSSAKKRCKSDTV